MVKAAKAQGLTDIVLLHEHRGVPSALTIRYASAAIIVPTVEVYRFTLQ